MQSNLVSIIIPTYMRADLLPRAINSVLGQTYQNIELVVVDDNDPESIYRRKTEEIMLQYKNDPRVVYVKHEFNKNGAAARNTGIKFANGNFIGFLDDDDLFLPKKIEKQVKYLVDNVEYNGVYCGRFQKGKKIIGRFSGDLSEQILTLTFSPTTPSLLFRSISIKDLGGFNEQFRRHQDFDLLIRFFNKNRIGVLPEPLVEIGQNEGENELHGDLLEKNKEAFLNQFNKEINTIDERVKGFKNKVFISHYTPVFFDHISQKYIRKAFCVYIKGIKKSFIKFNISLLKYSFKYLKYRIKRNSLNE